MVERRRFLRFETLLDAFCEFGDKRSTTAYTVKNISKEGALLLLDKPVEAGTEIKLSMDVPGDNVPIFISCRVAWQKDTKKPREEAPYETGVKFSSIDRLDKGRLLEYIYSQWLKLMDRKQPSLSEW